MGTLKVDTVTNVAGSGAPDATAVTVDNVALSSLPQMEYAASASAPTSPSVGSLWYNTTSDAFYMYDGTGWNTITFTSPPPAYLGARGICAGGRGFGSYYNVIDYITITNAGNATDFGDLDRVVSGLGGCSNGSRGITAGGVFDASHINYITISTTGNSSSFGDLTTPRSYISGLANKTRAVFGGGTNTSTNQGDVTMDYITVATTGDATDFGDINSGNYANDYGYGATNSKTRGLFAGSGLGSKTYYITIDTPSNATEFGDLSDSRSGVAACTDGSRAVISGSQSDATIDYVEIATTGNATNFGDMDQNVSKLTGTGDGTTGVFMGGYRTSFGGQAVNFIQKLTIQTPANATDFGDLTEARHNCCGFSGD